MSRRRNKQFHDVQYHEISQEEESFDHAQFQPQLPQKIPWKAICLAIALFLGGTLLLIMGSLIVSGHLDNKYSDRMWPIIILGFLMFIPGAYHVRIAYYAYSGHSDYSFDDIPDFE